MRKLVLVILLFVFIDANAQSLGGIGGAALGGAQATQVGDNPTTKPQFTMKQYFKGLRNNGQDSLQLTHLFLGSTLLPGTSQIYNKDYWKLPIVYGGIGGMIYGAASNNSLYQTGNDPQHKSNRNLFLAGAALMYWGTILDGVISYESKISPLPARSALYSALLPGLGQIHNGDWWKLPIFYGGLATSGYTWYFNGIQYNKYKEFYRQSTEGTYEGNFSQDNLLYYRDLYKRYRDYSMLATAIIYLLQIIDADVFATMTGFDVSNDLSMNIEPTFINPITPTNNHIYTNALGIKLQFNF